MNGVNRNCFNTDYFTKNECLNVKYISLIAVAIIVGLACVGLCVHATILDPYCYGDYYKRFVLAALGMGGVCSLALSAFLIPKIIPSKSSTN